jgi:acyl-CoA synthetase (AMP-forming)/AMP-acid ligase II
MRDRELAKRTALESQSATWSYSELASRVARVAGALRARGLRRGNRVALLAARNVNTVAGIFGVMAAGGVVCPVEPRLGAADLAARLASAEIDWLLADREYSSKATEVGASNTLLLEHALDAQPNVTYAELSSGDDALMLFTSGSTGAPKAVLLTHGNLLANAEGVAERTGVNPADRLLHAMPLFHTNGINNQLIVPFARGATVSVLEHFRADSFFAEIARWRPTYITGVPTMYSRLLAFTPSPEVRRLRFARCGAAPLSEELHRRIEAHLGVPLVTSYGLSEATCTSVMNPPNACRVGTVGPALQGQLVEIREPGSDRPLCAGQDGEICISGATVMKGYVPEQAAADGPGIVRGWLRTGDLGRFDSDGYLSITGRLKDIIIRGGENLSPGLIESALAAHPAVRSCAVVGAPDADLGEVPIAFVVARERGPLDERALRDQVEQRLSRIHVPARFVTLVALPENAIGKIDRKALQVLATQLNT